MLSFSNSTRCSQACKLYGVTDEETPAPVDDGDTGPEGLWLGIALLVVVFMGLVIAMAVIQTQAQ